MIVSLSWLKEYINIKTDPQRLADSLTMSGLEVESFHNPYAHLKNIIVGEIKNIIPHPNADRLQICEVETGDEILSIVCGASNVKVNMLVPLALPGAVVQNGMVIKKSSIRGVKSNGMLCSEAELGIGAGKDGIMELTGKNIKIGDSFIDALNLSDSIFEISITPNRSDCLSVIGIAREIGAFLGEKVKYPHINPSAFSAFNNTNIADLTSVTIEDKELCPRYAAGLIENIKIAPSPLWLTNRLKAAGLKPINNIVDIANFVMLETGQPLHAFDFDALEDKKIIVKRASENQSFTTLDDKEHILSSDMLMICDGKRPVAIAGVMGGLNSEIKENTTRVLIESAYFNPTSIRKTSKILKINSDAAYRFERGIDPEITIFALKRAATLMAEIAGGTIVNGLIDENFITEKPKLIQLTEEDTAKLLGIVIDKKRIKTLLESVDFKIEIGDDGKLSIFPPSFRVDIAQSVDIIEEIARLYGYNNIPTRIPILPAKTTPHSKELLIKNRIKKAMVGFGFTEIINYSFINPTSCDRLRLPADHQARKQVTILNPLAQDQSVMRSSLIPGMLETAALNISSQVKRLKIFEIGKTFLKKEYSELPQETNLLTALWTGGRTASTWHNKEIETDFYDIKGVVESLLRQLRIDQVNFTAIDAQECFFTKKGNSANIIAGADKIKLGIIAEIDGEVLQNYGLKQKVFIFEINFDLLTPLIPDEISAVELSKFPAIIRDMTIIVPNDIPASDVYQTIESSKEKLIERIEIFDIYQGEPIDPNKKSISFRINYRSHEKTLKDEDINRIHTKLSDKVTKKFNADLPA